MRQKLCALFLCCPACMGTMVFPVVNVPNTAANPDTMGSLIFDADAQGSLLSAEL